MRQDHLVGFGLGVAGHRQVGPIGGGQPSKAEPADRGSRRACDLSASIPNTNSTIASDENSYKVEANGTDGDGKPMHIEFNAQFDGKDYPASGVPWADMVSVKRIDAHTVQVIQKKGGQVMMTITCEVPPMERHTRAC